MRPLPREVSQLQTLLSPAARGHLFAVAACALTIANVAAARPLTLRELAQLGDFVACAEACPAASAAPGYEQHLARLQCIAACGDAPRLWEKDGVFPISRSDHELAWLEYQYDQDQGTQPTICYADADETIVVPGALCTGTICQQQADCSQADCEKPDSDALDCTVDPVLGPVCWWPQGKRPAACPDVVCSAKPAHTQDDCADADGDGLPAWLESSLAGFDPASPSAVCNASRPCAIDETCAYVPELGSGLCKPRVCAGDCTAFHLELVAQDDTELIVHLHYDFTPVPARALNLYLSYSHTALTLQDSRALAPLLLNGKELATSHLSDGTLRLTIFDPEGTEPIPTGPIVELVFRRQTTGPTTIGFATDDALQTGVAAPYHGAEASLADDALWGSPIAVAGSAAASTQVSVWYDFEALSSPMALTSAPSAEELCSKVSSCSLESDPVRKAGLVARLAALQSAPLRGGQAISGVSGAAVWLDGTADHVQLPIDWREPLAPLSQSFSQATWFYAEGASGSELKTTPQVLFAHMGFDERTRFALLLRPEAGGTVRLTFLEGDLLQTAPAPKETTVVAGISLRTWHHAGFVLDAEAGKVELYFDGQRVLTVTISQPPALVACPQFFAATDVVLHEEGDIAGGRPPEDLFVAAFDAGAYGIWRVAPAGTGRTAVIDDNQFSYRDPDYSPLLDRLVYSGNVSGAFEIWVSDGDGQNRRQLTVGFGDAQRGYGARHPRWAPDGTGIVFESGAFEVLADDNSFARAKHLYYLPWNRTLNIPAIEGPGGSAAAQLDYAALLSAQAISDVRLTGGDLARHHTNPHFLLGANDALGQRGVLLLDAVDALAPAGHTVLRLTIKDSAALSALEPVAGLGTTGDDLRLLAAHRSEKAAAPAPIVTERVAVERSSTLYEPNGQFMAVAGPGDTVIVTHTPTGYAPNCWDRNLNKATDSDEDRNDDGFWNTLDCAPSSVDDLFVEFDALTYSPELEDAQGNPKTASPVLTALSKELQLDTRYVDGRAFVRVAVVSALNDRPLPAGEIAVLSFVRPQLGSPAVPFGAFQQVGYDHLLIKDLANGTPPGLFDPATVFERVEDASFSPSGDRLLLAAVSHARPVLLRTESLLSATNAAKLLATPARIRGLDWERKDRFMACNWVGGAQHPTTKALLSGFRGGLDELKVWRGLRDPDAFRSEAERGREFLIATGLDGALDTKLPSCSASHQDCPDYHLCVQNQCRVVACDPEDPYSCAKTGGRCTLRPLDVEQEFKGPKGKDLFKWVCATDCDVDAQCFVEQCLNGPCRFCDDATLTCIECRESIQQFGGLTIEGIEGCPDQRSFRCESGACETDCYALEDGESIYLCDPATEYCQAGSCVLHHWDWWDLAPGTLAGAGEMRQAIPADTGPTGWKGYTQAVDQRIPLMISAYGVSDYGVPPEVQVDVKGGPFYAEWQHVGTVTVHAATAILAQQRPITLSVPHPFTDLRLRLVTSPYDNAMGGATGLGAEDRDFCPGDLAAGVTGPVDTTVCDRRPQGTRYALGYELDIAPSAAISACLERGGPGCPFSGAGELDYLRGGAPAAIIADVHVRGASVMNAVSSNKVCAYGGYGAGELLPTDASGVKKVFYGDIATERSPERDVFCAQPGADCSSPGAYGLVDFPTATKGFGLLNCNVIDPGHQGETAALTFANIPILVEWPASSGAVVIDTGDKCLVELTAKLNAPCVSVAGGDATLDPTAHPETYYGAGVPFGLLDMTHLRSFGHGDGFQAVVIPTVPLTVQLEGYSAGTQPLQLRCPDGVIAAGGGATQTLACPGTKSVGAPFSLEVLSQPSDTMTCTFEPDGTTTTSGWHGPQGTTVVLRCAARTLLRATLAGLPPTSSLVLRGHFLDDGKTVSAIRDLTRTTNGPFDVTSLPVGGAFDLRVKTAPEGLLCTIVGGSGVMGSAPPLPIAITCKVASTQALRVHVTGLGALLDGALVVSSEGGGAMSVFADGDAEFPDPVLEGSDYALRIDASPPGFACNISSGGEGVVPGEAFLAAEITCTELDAFTVRGAVTGLNGPGLTLSLNGGPPLVVPFAPDSLSSVPVVFEETLPPEAPWTVTVLTSPSQSACTVLDGDGVIDGADPEPFSVICKGVLAGAAYGVSGSVSGLVGSGLRLKFRNSAITTDVAPGVSNWAMATKQPKGFQYEVVVDRQPSGPTQVCEVAGGVGVIAGDVTGIAVTCKNAATVTVEVHVDGADGAEVGARLYSLPTATSAGRLLAKAPKTAQIKKGIAVFQMAELALDENEQPVTAHVTPGSYALLVMVNADGDTDTNTGQPRFNAGDPGAYKEITASATSTAPVVLSAMPLGLPATVFPVGPIGPVGARCYWHGGIGGLDTPVKLSSPVVTTTSVACSPPEGESTCETGGLSFSIGAVWPKIDQPAASQLSYTVTCWSDADENGVKSPGDLYGYSFIWNPYLIGLNAVLLSPVTP